MQRIAARRARAADELRERAVSDECYVVHRGVALGHRPVGGRAMVGAPRQFLNVLVQRPAERHVELLVAATDREQRHACGQRPPDQRQRRRIASRVEQRVGPRLIAAIAHRLDVGRAAGEQEAVQTRQQRLAFDQRSQRRDDHGNAARGDGHRADIGVGGCMEIVALREHAGRYADQRG